MSTTVDHYLQVYALNREATGTYDTSFVYNCYHLVYQTAVPSSSNLLCFFRVVKLSSPYLNVLIVVGVILFYVDVILFGVDEGTPASRCTVNALCMVSTS